MKRQSTIITCVACLAMARGFAMAQEVSDEEINERFSLVDGDILVPNENVSGVYRAQLWPGGRVPYLFSAQVTPDNRQRMLDAMAEWEAVSGARFVPRTNQDDYVLILHSEESNSSAVGRVGGQQYLRIRNWDRKFVIVHELGHALGLYHEQSREDRFTACNGRPCILIQEENISQTACSGGPCNFNSTVRPPHGGEFGPYDFDSVMHYSQCAFSKNANCPIGGGETIIVPAPNEEWQNIIGHVSHLSTGDMLTMDFLYPGVRECPGKIVSSNPGFKAIDARIPSDSSGEVFGWDAFEIEFDGDASGLTPADFLIGTTTGSTPRIKELVIDGGRASITLDRPMVPGSWLSILIKPCNDGNQVGFLPGDVNGNRTTLPSDLLALIDCLNGERECVEHSGDIDRSMEVAPADIIALTDLLNGAGPFAPWSGRSLPTQPDAWVAGVRPAIGLIGIPIPGEFEVTVCRNNEGPSILEVPLSIAVGDPVETFNNLESIKVERLSCARASVFVPTPFVPFACGGAPEYLVRACANYPSDTNKNNDCKSDVLEIAPAFYDLDFTVLADSTESCINEQVCWDVRVCNHGTVTSYPTTARTGICPNEGDAYGPCVGGGPYFFMVPSIDAGMCWTSSPGFCITPLPGAFRNQFIKAGTNPYNADICTAGNQDDKPITVDQPEIAITDIDLPDDVVGSVGPRRYEAVVCNSRDCDVNGVLVRFCVTGACADVFVNIPGQSCVTAFAYLSTPACFASCGSACNFPVNVCSLWPDSLNDNDDCRQETLRVEAPWWNLKFDIISAPTSARACSTIQYTVRITNVGNVRSIPGKWRTGVCRNSDDCDQRNCAGFPNPLIECLDIPVLEPGQSINRQVAFTINCGAIRETQYIKAGVSNCNGFADFCTSGNCADARSIRITN